MASYIDAVLADLVHQRRAVTIRAGAIRPRVNQLAGVAENIRPDVGQPFALLRRVDQVAQQHSKLVVRVLARIPACPRSIQDRTFQPWPIGTLDFAAESPEDWVVTRSRLQGDLLSSAYSGTRSSAWATPKNCRFELRQVWAAGPFYSKCHNADASRGQEGRELVR